MTDTLGFSQNSEVADALLTFHKALELPSPVPAQRPPVSADVKILALRWLGQRPPHPLNLNAPFLPSFLGVLGQFVVLLAQPSTMAISSGVRP